MTSAPSILSGRAALVTGVSRHRGIGFAVARRLAGLGTDLLVHSYREHDAARPWGAGCETAEDLVAEPSASGVLVEAIDQVIDSEGGFRW